MKTSHDNVSAEETIKKRYPFYDSKLSFKDVELNGEQVMELMHEYSQQQRIALLNELEDEISDRYFEVKTSDYADEKPDKVVHFDTVLEIINKHRG